MTPGVEPGPHEFVKSYSSLLPFQPTRNDFLDCCNGLLLFVEGCTLQYYVCNPMTKRCVAIPRGSMLENIIFASLAFDPSRSPHYRVVCIEFSEFNPPVRLHVLSSETGNWSMHETPFGYSFRCTLLRRCIYVDGTGNSRAIRLPQWKRLDPDGFGCAGSLRIVARTTGGL
ncbi:hypothetical protein OIU76_012931 [Salix suchowensis]|nr:hypothetical protein OIU76_012931 [Salix suchowensis]